MELTTFAMTVAVATPETPQWNNTTLGTNQKNRIEICAAHTHIGGGKAQRRNHFLGLQAFGSNLPMICIKEFVGLAIQAPDSGCDRVIEVGGHEPIAGIFSIKEVIGRFEQGQHLHDRVVLGISTVYGRYLLICDFDQAVAGGNAHAVVENLGEYAFGDFVEGMTGDAGTLQNGLESTGTDRVVLTIYLQQEAGILHCVFKNLCGAIVVIDLHVQIPERGASFHRFELKFSGWGGHPFAAGFPVAQELKKIPRLRKATTEVVRPEMPECVGSQLMKLRIGDEI